MKNHYNRKYFLWQKKAGEYGASQDVWMYKKYIKDSDNVLDFGCGGGYILKTINCKKKYGVEINRTARDEAKKKGIVVFDSIDKIPSSLKLDVIMSHHVIEHVENPYNIIKQLKKHLKNNGLIICVVPIDDWRKQKEYDYADINKHLYTWTPLLLGNLFSKGGYKIKKIEIITQAWIPLSRYYFKYMPKFLYYFLSRIWSMLILSRQIRIISTKEV